MSALDLLAEPGQDQMQSVIDDHHLRQMTLGDRRLEREVLEIFARQTVLTLERITAAEPALAAAAAHTLKGSARGIGAWRVAEAAARLERAAAGKAESEAMSAAIAELEAATAEVRAAIGARLRERPDHGWGTPLGERSRDH